MSLVDPSFELIDPCPDIHALFIDFDQRFFEGKLVACEVKWSPRMTTCAGVCSYEVRAGFCSIRLSKPLLTLRPRKDLIETLLHEMIHAYLFITCSNQDRDGHGPDFQYHMCRINSIAGTKITIYHSFHQEVALYKTHHWRCDGPCKDRRPYFGWVKRASNRAPGPNDTWFAQHQATCGGTFQKVKEPEGYQQKKKGSKKEEGGGHQGTLDLWVSPGKKIPPRPTIKKPKGAKAITGGGPSKPVNTLDGWVSPEKKPAVTRETKPASFSGSGTTLGGPGNGVSRLLDGGTAAGPSTSGQRLGGSARGVSSLLDRLEAKGPGAKREKSGEAGSGGAGRKSENNPSVAGSSTSPICLDSDDEWEAAPPPQQMEDDWDAILEAAKTPPRAAAASEDDWDAILTAARTPPRQNLNESIFDPATSMRIVNCPRCGLQEYQKYLDSHLSECRA